MNTDNSSDKSVRDTKAEDVKSLILKEEGEGAQNDYAGSTVAPSNSGQENTARKTNEKLAKNDKTQGAYKHSDNPESKDSDRPYEDSLMPEYHNDQPLSEVIKKQENEE